MNINNLNQVVEKAIVLESAGVSPDMLEVSQLMARDIIDNHIFDLYERYTEAETEWLATRAEAEDDDDENEINPWSINDIDNPWYDLYIWGEIEYKDREYQYELFYEDKEIGVEHGRTDGETVEINVKPLKQYIDKYAETNCDITTGLYDMLLPVIQHELTHTLNPESDPFNNRWLTAEPHRLVPREDVTNILYTFSNDEMNARVGSAGAMMQTIITELLDFDGEGGMENVRLLLSNGREFKAFVDDAIINDPGFGKELRINTMKSYLSAMTGHNDFKFRSRPDLLSYSHGRPYSLTYYLFRNDPRLAKNRVIKQLFETDFDKGEKAVYNFYKRLYDGYIQRIYRACYYVLDRYADGKNSPAVVNEISSKFIQDRMRKTYQGNAEKYDYGDLDTPADSRIRQMRHAAADRWFEERPSYWKGYSDDSIDHAADKYRDIEAFYLDPTFKSVDDLIAGLKAGVLLIHCRCMVGREAQDTVYPEAGECVKAVYGCEFHDMECELPELVFASDNFSWTEMNSELSKTRNGIYFVRSDNFVRYLGDSYVQLPNGTIENRGDNIPGTVEAGDWYSEEPAEVVAILRKKRSYRKATLHESVTDGDNAKLDNFNRWFAGSKVVDTDGSPLMCYHGTPKGGFTVFNTIPGVDKKTKWQLLFGSHFTPNQKQAEEYQLNKAGNLAKGHMLYNVYLSIKNPLDLTTSRIVSRPLTNNPRYSLSMNPEFIDLLHDSLPPQFLKHHRANDSHNEAYDLWDILLALTPMKARQLIESWGFDGVVYDAVYQMGPIVPGYYNQQTDKSYIALYPTQIKSATDNNGNFDPDDPDIRH